MRSIPLLLSLALALTASVPLRAADPDVAQQLSGSFHLTALADLKTFLAKMPELGEQGLIAEQIDDLVSRGIPDPRTNMRTLALGTQFGRTPDGILEGVAIGTSDMELVPVIRNLAAQNGVSLSENAYRGVAFVTGTFEGQTSRFADATENLMLIGFDKSGKYQGTKWIVDTVQGRRASYKDTFHRSLTPGTYITGRMVLSRAVRSALSGTKLESLKHLTGGSAEVKSGGKGIQMDLRVSATSSIKASIALSMLRKKLRTIAEESNEPAVKRLLLQHTTLDRSGPTIKILTNSPRDDFVMGALALQELLRQSGLGSFRLMGPEVGEDAR
jgi:hypothetical protein